MSSKNLLLKVLGSSLLLTMQLMESNLNAAALNAYHASSMRKYVAAQNNLGSISDGQNVGNNIQSAFNDLATSNVRLDISLASYNQELPMLNENIMLQSSKMHNHTISKVAEIIGKLPSSKIANLDDTVGHMLLSENSPNNLGTLFNENLLLCYTAIANIGNYQQSSRYNCISNTIKSIINIYNISKILQLELRDICSIDLSTYVDMCFLSCVNGTNSFTNILHYILSNIDDLKKNQSALEINQQQLDKFYSIVKEYNNTAALLYVQHVFPNMVNGSTQQLNNMQYATLSLSDCNDITYLLKSIII